MFDSSLKRRRIHPFSRAGFLAATASSLFSSFIGRSPCERGALFSSSSSDPFQATEDRGWWIPLPPFPSPSLDPHVVSKALMSPSLENDEPVTALKWVRRCRPDLPVSLLQKLFRLRRVRKCSTITRSTDQCNQEDESEKFQRISAKATIDAGNIVLLPSTVKKLPCMKHVHAYTKDEVEFIQGLVLYKDSAILVINKPPGLAVQGGVGIKYSIDAIAATALKFESPELPRLVHRLDKDCSGVFVMGRTQISSSVLHSIFRERTSGALDEVFDVGNRPFKRTYWALVIGTPKKSKGLISARLSKIVVDNDSSERMAVVEDPTKSSVHALTNYKVIKSSVSGYSWLELSPLTGRKHQLRVHCAEVLGTPIVGDYKYGWRSHRRWEPLPGRRPMEVEEEYEEYEGGLPWGLSGGGGGSLRSKRPRLHLHCREMVLPDSVRVVDLLRPKAGSTSRGENLRVVAPLPQHMQVSWDVLSFREKC